MITAVRRSVGAAAALLLAAVFAACAGLPTSGPVKVGLPIAVEGEQPDFAYVPDGPSPGMTPEQIVVGFLDAGSGPRGNWATARDFLAPEFRDVWQPDAGVTVFGAGDRAFAAVGEDDAEIVMTVEPDATVDSTGAYAVADGTTKMAYRLEQQSDGQWRIVEAPDGIVLDDSRFASVFRAYSLMFFDPTYTYLVPDVRWFPTDNDATRVTEALVDGVPSPWLADAVVSTFSASAGLAQPSVPIASGGVAQVSLKAAASGLDQEALDRMQTQLETTLSSAGVAGVEMLVDGQVLDAQSVAVRSTKVDPRILAVTDGQFGYISGGEVETLTGLSSQIVAAEPDAIELDADRVDAAIRSAAGVARASSGLGVQPLDARPDLLAPTIDPLGYVYAVPASDPGAVIAYAGDGSATEITGAWTGASGISAMRVSRDGARVVAVVRDGSASSVWVASVIRDDDGRPVAFGEHLTLATPAGTATEVAWEDDTTIAVAGTTSDAGAYVLQVPVGGPGETVRSPSSVTTVVGGNTAGSARLRDADGDVYLQRGANWSLLTSGVDVLAVQQGLPR